MTIPDKTKLKLLKLQYELKEVAIPIGSMHAWWDIIFDIDAVLKGNRAIISDPDELIRISERVLRRRDGHI